MVETERLGRPGADDEPSGTLAFLRGTWELTRSVRDGGRTGRFDGVATFSPLSADTLAYREAGVLSFDGRQVPATRRYRYRAAGGAVEVDFDDGRFFHVLDLRQGHWEAEHACGRDRYHGTFVLQGPDRFTTRWLVGTPGERGVAGPTKDQELISVYRRLRVGRAPVGGARCPHAHL